MKITKLRAGIVTAVVGIALGAGGFAFAAFTQTQTASAGSKAATFAPVVVTGVVADQNLLPGDGSTVTLTINNPDGNTVNAKIDSITHAGDAVKVVANSVDPGCAGYVVLADPAGSFSLIGPNRTATITIQNGVQFREDMPIVCQGMQFTAEWTVSLSPKK